MDNDSVYCSKRPGKGGDNRLGNSDTTNLFIFQIVNFSSDKFCNILVAFTDNNKMFCKAQLTIENFLTKLKIFWELCSQDLILFCSSVVRSLIPFFDGYGEELSVK